MKNVNDLTGAKFGRLTVVERKWCEKKKRNLWFCQCECGNSTLVLTSDLLAGKSTSCGCFRKSETSQRRKTHGMSNSRLYRIWNAMKERCQCTTNAQYNDYGGRGIIVCAEWRDSFETFYDWAISNGYAEHLTIDRIDTNGNYCPDNCRWATPEMQNSNKRNNHILTYNGKTQTIQRWSKETGIPFTTLLYRVNNGWTVKAALTLLPSARVND